jgi:hypothetical protein
MRASQGLTAAVLALGSCARDDAQPLPESPVGRWMSAREDIPRLVEVRVAERRKAPRFGLAEDEVEKTDAQFLAEKRLGYERTRMVLWEGGS